MTVRGDLLMIVHRVPYPPDKGDKIRSYNQLRFLTEQGWRVHLCALADDPVDLGHVEELGRLCATVAIEPINPLFQKIRSLSAPLRGLPMSARFFYSSDLQKKVDQILSHHPVSAVLCFCGPIAEYLRRSSCTPLSQASDRQMTCVMDLVDVDSDKWEQYAQRHAVPLKWVFRLEGWLLRRYEQQITHWFDAVALVSEAEADVFRNRTGLLHKIHAVGNGVDLAYFHPSVETTGQRNLRISFCGAMGYLPNIDAVCWFAREVLPRIRETLGDVEFWIVGGGAGEEVRVLETYPGVRVTGRVADVRPFVWESDLSVAPIRIARGIQNKVLEAMAMGIATLVTPQAFEGLEVEAGRDLLVVPAEPELFAAKAIEMLRELGWRHDMALHARRAVEEKYSWSARLQALDELLRGASADSAPFPVVE
ncbi:TIGR03087 family PEP-CTERM/XrtA system glycosyltransferase [Pelobacter propionicus]|nr:TIGR03087 family PEP-CTERM/XrtA system glycosyltransferase [Pelobacter propionicus]